LAVFLTFNAVCLSFLIFSGFLDKLWFHNIFASPAFSSFLKFKLM
jgi:membrane protein involved in D-alanine export